jgi:hypothetical protein
VRQSVRGQSGGPTGTARARGLARASFEPLRSSGSYCARGPAQLIYSNDFPII